MEAGEGRGRVEPVDGVAASANRRLPRAGPDIAQPGRVVGKRTHGLEGKSQIPQAAEAEIPFGAASASAD